MSVHMQRRLTGVGKAAIVLMSLDDAASSAIFKHLDEGEIERVTREVASIGHVSAEIGESVLTEVQQLALTVSTISTGGVENARRLLAKSLGPEQARRILDRVLHSLPAQGAFAALERVNSQQLSKFILGEHPQTVALVLAHLNPTSAAELLTQLPDDMRADVLMRMANLGDIPPDVIARISGFIDQRLRALGGPSHDQRGGVKAVADLFNRLDRSVSRPALEHIESAAPDMAVAIRNLMFVFDDLVHVEDAGIREIANRADRKEMMTALKGANDEIRQRFFQNMSKRAADLMKEEMEVMGAVRVRDVEKAQRDVLNVARKLEEDGLIVLGTPDGEPYVA